MPSSLNGPETEVTFYDESPKPMDEKEFRRVLGHVVRMIRERTLASELPDSPIIVPAPSEQLQCPASST